MIRSTGISINRPWTIFQREHEDTVAESRDEVGEAQSRRQRELLLEAHKEAARSAFFQSGRWYF